jgi:TPR repeat protein
MQTSPVNAEKLFQDAVSELAGAMHRREFHAAFTKLEEASKAGHIEALYQLAVGTETFNQNLEPSFNWCLQAAETGHKLAQEHIAEMYEKGRGTPKDTAKAVYWRQRAASNSH